MRVHVKAKPSGLFLGRVLAFAIVVATAVVSFAGCSGTPRVAPKDAHAAQLASCTAMPTRDQAEDCIASVNLAWGYCNVNAKWVKCESR